MHARTATSSSLTCCGGGGGKAGDAIRQTSHLHAALIPLISILRIAPATKPRFTRRSSPTRPTSTARIVPLPKARREAGHTSPPSALCRTRRGDCGWFAPQSLAARASAPSLRRLVYLVRLDLRSGGQGWEGGRARSAVVGSAAATCTAETPLAWHASCWEHGFAVRAAVVCESTPAAISLGATGRDGRRPARRSRCHRSTPPTSRRDGGCCMSGAGNVNHTGHWTARRPFGRAEAVFPTSALARPRRCCGARRLR